MHQNQLPLDEAAPEQPREIIPFHFTAATYPVLKRCRASYPSCPFGCAKDGAPNCAYNIQQRRCPPSQSEGRHDADRMGE